MDCKVIKGDGLSQSSGLIAIIKVATFAALPAAGSVLAGTMRYVQTQTGTYILGTRKKRGWYESDGVSTWNYAGDNTRIALDALYDNTSSGLVATNVQAAIDETEARVDTVEANRVFQLSAGRNQAAATDIWLRKAQNIPLNLAPYRLAHNATLIAITATGNAADTWDAEVYKNAFVRAGGVPLDANKIAELAISAANSAAVATNVALVAGDEVGVFMRGTSINRPSVNLWFVRA